MRDLVYHLLLADMDLVDKFEISAAGVFGHQRLTPRVDTETLLYGYNPSNLYLEDGIITAKLSTGTYSPALAVRAILNGLREDRKVRIFTYDIGLPWALKRFPSYTCAHPSFEWTHVMDGVREKNFGDALGGEPTTSRDTLKTLRRTMERLQHNIEEFSDAEHVITECVPGGTTTASALLGALGCEEFSGISSSSDSKILASKRVLVDTMIDNFESSLPAPRRGDPRLYPMFEGDPWLVTRIQLMKFYLMDHFQIFMTEFLLDEEFFLARSRKAPKIILGGGVQMLAPRAFIRFVDMNRSEFLDRFIELKTTPWVTTSLREQSLGRIYFGDSPSTHVPFLLAGPAWAMYNDPVKSPKEGLGLGALLHIASRDGYSDGKVSELLQVESEVFEGHYARIPC